MNIHTDVLIVGTGAAGLYCALNLREDLNITLLSKSSANECNSFLAQGGISVARGEKDFPSFIDDTLKAGNYKNDKKAVQVLASESMDAIDNLVSLGVPFDSDLEGNVLYTREGAHSINRIVHCADRTGEKVHSYLLKEVLKRDNITMLEDSFLVDLITKNNKCIGGVAFNKNNPINIFAKSVVIATGGIGGLFNNSTNFQSISGDGIAIAFRRGVNVINMNYIQFHPTALYDDYSMSRKFLISEAVRGEGGKLLNINGERFVDELLPRDKVTAEIFKEEMRTSSNFVYLDTTFMKKDFLAKRFPTIYDECFKRGIDISNEPIPVTPAQHYFMGGISVDLNSRTSMENLYACGEASCTGVHGSNRLASNSLLEGLVFSKRAATHINNNIRPYNICSYDSTPTIEGDKDYYKKLFKNILIQAICDVRGDIVNELVAL